VARVSNTRGGACNSKAAPYFNIVPSYIMFQQNGRRTRGSASTTRRVVYLKHTIPPSPSLSFSLFLSRFSSLLPIHQRQDQRRGDVRVRERERERERESATTIERWEGRMEALRVRGWREGRRRPSATNPHSEPPLSPLAFASSIEGWRMASRQRYAN